MKFYKKRELCITIMHQLNFLGRIIRPRKKKKKKMYQLPARIAFKKIGFDCISFFHCFK